MEDEEEEEGDGVVVEGGAAGGRDGVAQERRQHRRAPDEDHRTAQGQRAYTPSPPPSPQSPHAPSFREQTYCFASFCNYYARNCLLYDGGAFMRLGDHFQLKVVMTDEALLVRYAQS